MFPFRVVAAAMVVAALGAGCAKAQAKTEPALPQLAPPPPPPRVVEIYNDEPIPTVEPSPAEIALNTPANKPPVKPVIQRAEMAKPEPEPPRIEPERPTATPLSLTLKPAPGSESSTETSIRALIARAARDLGRVDYGSLSVDGKAQYDTARRFMQQSEDALRTRNLVYAGKLADKAATMAGVLVR